jgi:hypothetical protein
MYLDPREQNAETDLLSRTFAFWKGILKIK